MDNGPHACDLVRRFLGEVAAVEGAFCDTAGLADGCEMEAIARFRGRDGGTGEVRSSWALASGYLTLDVQGTEGRLHVETAPWALSGVLASGRRVRKRYLAERLAERRFRGLFGCERSLVQEVEAFAAGTSARQARTAATGWDGCRVTEMIDAAYRSARSRRDVALVPDGPAPPARPALRERWA
jgi:predicted dehydrogenase